MGTNAAPQMRPSESSLSSFLTFLASLPPEDIKTIEIEEMAIASAWYSSIADSPEKCKEFVFIPEAVDSWADNVEADPVQTEGRRRQPLLREILDKAVVDGIGKLTRSELDVIVAAYELTQRVTDEKLFERLRIFFDRHIESIRAKRKALPTVSDLTAIENMLQIITSADIEKAKARSVKSFAGVDLPTRGPLYTHSGNVKVMDSVPDDCMVVVEGGSCIVNGYVLGRVAATVDCEVRDNISGVVIVNRGAVRARNIIGNAYVVSKSGGVYAYGTESPELVFGGSSIHVRENARMGAYISPVIEVEGDVTDGEFRVSKRFSAQWFRKSPTRKLVIGLRRGITSEDYGEYVDPGAKHLLARIVNTRQRRDNQRTMKALTEEECEHFSSSAVLYLLGGEERRGQIEEMNRAKRRLALLDRLIAGNNSLCTVVKEELALLRRAKQAKDEALPPEESSGAAEDVAREMRQIESERDVDEDLLAEGRELRSLSMNLFGRASKEAATLSVLTTLQSKKQAWSSERKTLHQTLSEKESALRASQANKDLLGAQNQKLTKNQLLKKLLGIAYKRPVGDPLADRAGAEFVQLMLRLIENRRQRIGNYGRSIEGFEEDLQREGGKLKSSYHISPPPDTDEGQSEVSVTGRFEAGIAICTDIDLLDDPDSLPGSQMTTPDSDGATRTYVSRDERIVERT